MARRIGRAMGFLAVAFAAGVFVGHTAGLRAQGGSHIYELRTYTAPAGKLDALVSRFRDQTIRIFDTHGMRSVGYFVPSDAPASENTLIYILEHDSRDAAAASWDAFRQDPEWQRVAEDTQRDGPLVSNVESVFMTATDFSAIR